jgi:hypothetical protein
MNSGPLFYMDGPLRQLLLTSHSFYVEQARKRLLSQFGDIEAEADKATEEWLNHASHRFNPDEHDPGDFYEAAHQEGLAFYELLSDMARQTRLSVVAGMFHEWEKQLREWLVHNISHWHRGDNVKAKVWGADFPEVAAVLAGFGWDFRNTGYFRMLDACRLVVNVYKHGDGKSLDGLRSRFPEFLSDPLDGTGLPAIDIDYRNHTNLSVSDEQIQSFSDSIVEFWRNVPERIVASEYVDAPEWFEKAFLKDRPDLKQANSK